MLINDLQKSKLGCHVYGVYVGCIMYADDLLLISASIIDLQAMLNICHHSSLELGIKFNANKSKCVFAGPNQFIRPINVNIARNELEWVDRLKYLGTFLVSGKKLTFDLADCKRKFFGSVNNIFCKAKFCSDVVKLKLIESHCLPILLYAIESISLSNAQLQQINSW